MAKSTKSAEETAATKITLMNKRLSYVHVWEPKAMQDAPEGAKKKYSVSIIISKNDPQLAEIKAVIEVAKKNGLSSKFGGKYPPNLKMPLRDGDTDRADHEEYKDAYFISASSDRQPGIVDRKVKPILKQDEVYSGIYANVAVNFYPFAAGGSKGVACGLNHIQKTADGEALGGITTPEQEFTSLEDNEDGDDDLLGS